MTTFSTLRVSVIGAGLGGLCAALALRRAGHNVTLYERHDFAGEVGASLSVASNGSRWLLNWGLDMDAVKPVLLRKLVMHDWSTGRVIDEYGLGDYKEKFGTDYYNFHRIDMHSVLLETVQSAEGPGTPCRLVIDRRAVDVDEDAGTVTFDDGSTVTADLVIAADGIRSATREAIGVSPVFRRSDSCCYRCIISAATLHDLGLDELILGQGIEFWGGFSEYKIVLSACHDNETVSCYCFYLAARNGLDKEGWNISGSAEELCELFADLDPRLLTLFRHAEDIKMWRLYVHEEYPYWVRGRVALLGDAAHSMLPDQSQGFCQAIEDAAVLGEVFSPNLFDGELGGSVPRALEVYEATRKPRASKVQSASARARTDLSERIGWSSSTDRPGKLTIEEVCGYDLPADVRKVASVVV